MLEDLYPDIIIDHTNHPKHYGRLTSPSNTARGYNPVCGDVILIDIERGEDGSIRSVGFESNGCAISKAAASMMAEAIHQKSESEVDEIMNRFFDMVLAKEGSFEQEGIIGDMAALSGVRNFPSRVKCANLPWHTLKAAMSGEQQATTE